MSKAQTKMEAVTDVLATVYMDETITHAWLVPVIVKSNKGKKKVFFYESHYSFAHFPQDKPQPDDVDYPVITVYPVEE